MSSDNVVPFPQRGISVGGPIDDASVSLDIHGDDLDPDEITQLLGLSPTYSHRRGDRLRPDGHSFHTGAWLHRVKSDDVPDAPEVALGCLLDRLPSDALLWARLVQQYDIRLNFRIGFTGWNKGFILSAPPSNVPPFWVCAWNSISTLRRISPRNSTNGRRDRALSPATPW